MTPEERQELVDRLGAIKEGVEDGETIQTEIGDGGWMNRDDEYLLGWLRSMRCVRVKPKPLECWRVTWDMGGNWQTFETLGEAQRFADPLGTAARIVHMREVEE